MGPDRSFELRGFSNYQSSNYRDYAVYIYINGLAKILTRGADLEVKIGFICMNISDTHQSHHMIENTISEITSN